MGELGGISGKEAIRRFVCIGYKVVRQRGSHARLVHANGGKPLTIPLHRELKPGLLTALIRDANIDRKTFLGL